MSEVNVVRRAKLLDRQPVPVRVDVFLHGLPDDTLEHLRRAMEQGLTPSGVEFTGDDGSIAILQFTHPTARRLPDASVGGPG